jgi:hypothetical protein
VGGAGVLALRPVTAAVVAYYITMTKHKNHMVCEAACAAIAELGEFMTPLYLRRMIMLFLFYFIIRVRSAFGTLCWS